MISQATFKKYATSPADFRIDLQIECDGAVRRFGDVLNDWQIADFASMDAALRRCAGRSTKSTGMRYYFERPRGHSKTTDIAVTVVWALVFSKHPLRGFCFAADKDQAAILKDSISTLLRLNPWLSDILEVQTHRVVNVAEGHPGKTGFLRIETSDVASSYGILPDMIVCDELTHWLGDGSLWHSIISSAAKRSNCLLSVIANAGFADSWQWSIRETARTDPAWTFSRLDGPCASWLSPATLAEQQRMLPETAFQRLWLNQWSASGGDALRPADIEACFDDSLGPMQGNESDYLFVAGVDLGLKRDHSAVVVLAVPTGGRAGPIRLAAHKSWIPTAKTKIELSDVERHILSLDQRFGLESVCLDPWQAELLGQRLEADTSHRARNQRRRNWTRPWVESVPPSGPNLREQATLLIECFQDHRLRLYPCPPLRRDFMKLRVEEKSYGVRLTSPRDADGHGDLCSAFCLALVPASNFAGKKQTTVGAISNTAKSPYEEIFRSRVGMLSDSDDKNELFVAAMQRVHGLGRWPHGASRY